MIKLQAMEYRVFLQIPDAALRRSLGEQLSAKGYSLTDDAATADLLLLDDEGGKEGCAALRRQGLGQPILLLGLAPVQARAAGADLGLAKPFRFSELLRSLEQLSGKEDVAIGRFRLDANAREMIDEQGRSLRLTEKETAILAYLARAGDQAVGRDELLGEVWGYAGDASTHTVETHIYRLRRKLTENGGSDLLLTEAGGYRLGQSESKAPQR
jgi:DNA-binding response OmpR family regulator